MLLLIPAFVALYIYLRLSRRKRAGAFAESRLYALLTPDVSNIKSHTKFAILMAALFLLIIALANPQMGSKMVKGERAGIDVAIALDISNSMLAEDVQPNRLERAKKSVSDLIGKFSNDRVALIIFAGKAYTQLPLTSDYGAAKMFLDAVSTDMIEYQGTAIGEAITKCMETFGYGNEDIPWEKNKSRTIIIISDGENHEDDAVEMAKTAYAEGIVVNTIGMGTPNGVPIPQYSRGTRLGYKKDRDGNPVTTRLNEQMLQEIAHAGEDAGLGEHVGGRGDEEHLRALAVEGGVDPDAGEVLDVVAEKLHIALEGLRGQAHVVAGAVGVGHRLHGPVDADAH